MINKQHLVLRMNSALAGRWAEHNRPDKNGRPVIVRYVYDPSEDANHRHKRIKSGNRFAVAWGVGLFCLVMGSVAKNNEWSHTVTLTIISVVCALIVFGLSLKVKWARSGVTKREIPAECPGHIHGRISEMATADGVVIDGADMSAKGILEQAGNIVSTEEDANRAQEILWRLSAPGPIADDPTKSISQNLANNEAWLEDVTRAYVDWARERENAR